LQLFFFIVKTISKSFKSSNSFTFLSLETLDLKASPKKQEKWL